MVPLKNNNISKKKFESKDTRNEDSINILNLQICNQNNEESKEDEKDKKSRPRLIRKIVLNIKKIYLCRRRRRRRRRRNSTSHRRKI